MPMHGDWPCTRAVNCLDELWERSTDCGYTQRRWANPGSKDCGSPNGCIPNFDIPTPVNGADLVPTALPAVENSAQSQFTSNVASMTPLTPSRFRTNSMGVL